MYIILILTTLVVVTTISAGLVIRFREMTTKKVKPKSFLKINLSAFIPVSLKTKQKNKMKFI
jgi:hypothetical protein